MMPSTTDVWKPGIGLTLTKANLASVNEARANEEHPKSPISGSDELFKEFLDDNLLKQFKKRGVPPRYTRRAEALLARSR